MFNDKKWRIKNRDRIKARMKIWRQERRIQLLKLAGGLRCKKCGFKDVRALQVDHVKGIGTRNRLGMQTKAIFIDIKNNPKNYQVLCANCNWIKRVENEEHKHNKRYV
jgi:hypothetical protein|tara:strand:+ start:151 stop:474 length:324 start_codon:yes stop_codon:yes gene_type:complete